MNKVLYSRLLDTPACNTQTAAFRQYFARPEVKYLTYTHQIYERIVYTGTMWKPETAPGTEIVEEE